MFEQRLPSELDYPFIIPKGFPSIYKEWQLDPLSSNKQWSNNDIVRFNPMNMGKGVFDPWRSYLQFTVSTNANDSPVGLLQIDNSAQSFIDQLVIYSNSRQIQRITNYSVLAAYLNDVGLNQLISQGRQTQGLGYGSFDTMPFPRARTQSTIVPRVTSGTQTMTVSSGNIFPTIGDYYVQMNQWLTDVPITTSSKVCKGHASNSNPVMAYSDADGSQTGDFNTSCIDEAMNYWGYGNNIRGQYNTKFIENKFPESTQSIPNFQLQLAQSVSNGNYPPTYNSKYPYYTTVRDHMTQSFYFSSDKSTYSPQLITSANFGFNSFFCPFYTRGTFQPAISATVPQVSIFNGVYNQTKSAIYRRKFKVPLISAIIGALIDSSRFILIPLASITSLLLEITLDPYAMFTSGYSDYSELDQQGMYNMQKRNYIIQKITYKVQTYHFPDPQVDKYMDMAMVKQITLLTNFWALSNSYQIPGGSGANNSWIVGCNSTHLNQIVVLFVPNDYQVYTFARKHFRISNCVKKYWTKIGVDYWPPQPYKGNGGNVCSNYIDDDNSVFVQNIYWSGNFMFSKSPLPRINPYNFAINERPYNVTNKSTLYDPEMKNNHNYSFTSTSVNADTAMGMCWLHENRVVGKAAYVITYTPFKQSQNILQGINVSSISNFQVVFQCDQTTTFPRDQTMYIFTRSSGVVKYGKDGIRTFGRG